jgi:hypothetical protein
MESAQLDEDTFFSVPYGKAMEIYATRSEKELVDAAMIGVSTALGNDPQMLSKDSRYHAFVASFVTDVIGAYVARAAAAQLGLLSLGGVNSTGNTLSAFIPELQKVKTVVIVNEEAAKVILGDRDRTMNFLLAITSMTALLCKKNAQIAALFGLKKQFFGGLKFKV